MEAKNRERPPGPANGAHREGIQLLMDNAIGDHQIGLKVVRRQIERAIKPRAKIGLRHYKLKPLTPVMANYETEES